MRLLYRSVERHVVLFFHRGWKCGCKSKRTMVWWQNDSRWDLRRWEIRGWWLDCVIGKQGLVHVKSLGLWRPGVAHQSWNGRYRQMCLDFMQEVLAENCNRNSRRIFGWHHGILDIDHENAICIIFPDFELNVSIRTTMFSQKNNTKFCSTSAFKNVIRRKWGRCWKASFCLYFMGKTD